MIHLPLLQNLKPKHTKKQQTNKSIKAKDTTNTTTNTNVTDVSNNLLLTIVHIVKHLLMVSVSCNMVYLLVFYL